MTLPDVAMSGAVRLGPDVTCDGFLADAKARVQTHVHSDHMDGFDSSKGCQEVLVSKGTKQLLVLDYNADLPYRSNLKTLEWGAFHDIGGSRVCLLPCGHMLGAVQVLVELSTGERLGYSGDFQWPIEDVVQVDSLVVDATYGSPTSVRRFTQGECELRFLELVGQQLARGPVYIYSHRGTTQRALQLLSEEVDCHLVGSRRLCQEAEVYREFGYPIGIVLAEDSKEGVEALRERRCVRFFGSQDRRAVDTESVSVVKLTARFCTPDDPVVEYSKRAFGVALSNHADFEGTLQYIKCSGAKYVVTDNTRGGKGYELALQISSRLGIEARPSSNFETGEWGR